MTDPQISREHFEIRWDDESVYLREHASTNGTRIRGKRLPFRRRLGSSWKRLRTWECVDVGQSRWQLRPRPRSLLIPAEKRKHSLLTRKSGQSPWVLGWRVLLPFMFVGFAFARLLMWLPSPWREASIGLVGALALVTWMAHALGKDLQTWDGALLALHLHHCVAFSAPASDSLTSSSSGSVASFPWIGAHRCSLWEPGDHPRCPGFYGSSAFLMALWVIATHARPWGGAKLVTDSTVFQCGNGQKLVHVITSDRCEECGDEWSEGAGHLAIASTQAELPSCCDAVFQSETSPVSYSWANQVFSAVENTVSEEGALLEEIDASVLWKRPLSQGVLSCVIGMDEHCAPVNVDLVKDGPHAVIVGTTGSGKSEALITLLAGLARNYSPASLRYVLIDYKGGASLSPLSTLPHTEVLLTDLLPSAALRSFEGLRALADSRASLLADRGYSSLSEWEDKDPRSAPCRVVIVCDEFTTFAQTHADLFEDILRWTAQGRALGVHIVLATQRPDRALTPAVLANVDLRIALRCRENSASQILVGSGQASTLPAIPGRGIIDGRGLIQCAWLPDLAQELDLIRQRWKGVSFPSLWIPALPDTIHESQVAQICGSHPAPGRICIGVADGTRHNRHLPVMWMGGHIRCEGTTLDARSIRHNVHGIAYSLSSLQGLPLISVSESAAHADIVLSPTSVELVDFLASWRKECILEIVDFEGFRAGLDSLLGSVHAGNLWSRFSQESTQAGIVIVCGTMSATTQWDKEGRFFSYRLLSSSSRHLLSQWGLTEKRFENTQGQWILAHAPSECLPEASQGQIQLPALIVPFTHQHAKEDPLFSTNPRELAFTRERICETLNEGDVAIVADAEELPSCSARFFRPHQWSQMSQLPEARIVIMTLSEDLRRVLLPRAYKNDWLLRVRHLPENRAIILFEGKTRLAQLNSPSTKKKEANDPH